MTDIVLTLQLPRGSRFIPIAMCANPDVLRYFKAAVLQEWEREVDMATDEIESAIRRNELDKLHRTLDLLIPAPEGEGAADDQ